MTVTATLAGMNDLAGGGFEPPDVQVSAGPGFVVELVNLAERVWRTGGGSPQPVQTLPLATLFRSGGDRLTDPRLLYDAQSGRWLASIADVDTNSVLVAVSSGTDPTQTWTVRSFAANGCPDQPRLGVADGIVVVSADVFASCNQSVSPVLGAELWVVNKQQLVSGAATVASTTYGPDRAFSTFAPVQSLSSTSIEYVVSVDNPSSRVVHLLEVDGIPPAAVRVQAVASLSITPLAPPPPAAQPPAGGVFRQPVIATNDDRILDAVWENGRLWFSANSGCIPVGDTAQRACARVVELSTASRTVSWDTDLSQPNASVFFPAIRPDASGNLVIVFGETSPTVQPELAVIARAPDGTFTAPVVIAQALAPYLGDRYGDYFGAARDPSDPSVVWVAGEAGSAVAGSRGWSTAVASVVVTGTPQAPPAAAGSVAPRVRAQALTGRVGATARLAYKALDSAAGVSQVVTVAGPKAVVFRARTAKGTLRAGQLYYVVWRPARSLRGRFTFCVRSVVAGGAASPESCAAVILR